MRETGLVLMYSVQLLFHWRVPTKLYMLTSSEFLHSTLAYTSSSSYTCTHIVYTCTCTSPLHVHKWGWGSLLTGGVRSQLPCPPSCWHWAAGTPSDNEGEEHGTLDRVLCHQYPKWNLQMNNAEVIVSLPTQCMDCTVVWTDTKIVPYTSPFYLCGDIMYVHPFTLGGTYTMFCEWCKWTCVILNMCKHCRVTVEPCLMDTPQRRTLTI